jgi:transcription antitermination factor NusG
LGKHWHAIYVKSRTEKKVGELLAERNIETYVPLVKTMRQWSDRKKMVEIPLLNGYVFVKTTEIENERVLQTKGVVNFVRMDGKIASIRTSEIDQLRQLVELGYQLDSTSVTKEYKAGEKVKITSGPLRGIEGYVVVDREQKLMEVLVESIGQCIRVRLPKTIVINS